MDPATLHGAIDGLDDDQLAAATTELLLEHLDLDYSRQATFLLEEHARRAGIGDEAMQAARASLKTGDGARLAVARAVLHGLAEGSAEHRALVLRHLQVAQQRQADEGRATLPGGLGLVGLVTVLRREPAAAPHATPVQAHEALWTLVAALVAPS